MKYKQWANHENWQPESSDLHILAKQLKGITPLVHPDSIKMMDVIALDNCHKKCRWLRLNNGLGGLIFSHTKDIIGPNGVLPLKITFLMQEKANGTWRNLKKKHTHKQGLQTRTRPHTCIALCSEKSWRVILA